MITRTAVPAGKPARARPWPRLGQPEEIVTAAAVMLPDAPHITGAHLTVDGGFLT